MQQEIWEDLTLLMPYLADIKSKVDTLVELKRITNGDTSIEILIHHNTGTGVHTYNISQEFIPFNMRLEVQILLNDAIDHLQKHYLNLAMHLEDESKKKINH